MLYYEEPGGMYAGCMLSRPGSPIYALDVIEAWRRRCGSRVPLAYLSWPCDMSTTEAGSGDEVLVYECIKTMFASPTSTRLLPLRETTLGGFKLRLPVVHATEPTGTSREE